MNLVRVKASPETERLGLSGKLGHVYGFTTPSITNPVVIGELREDYAESVYFEDTGQQLWFAAQLLEHLDHDPSLEATFEGRRFFYNSNGQWQEVTDAKEDVDSGR